MKTTKATLHLIEGYRDFLKVSEEDIENRLKQFHTEPEKKFWRTVFEGLNDFIDAKHKEYLDL